MSTGLSATYTIVAAITDITALTPVVVTLHAILSCASRLSEDKHIVEIAYNRVKNKVEEHSCTCCKDCPF